MSNRPLDKFLNLLRLANKEAGVDGWAKVSEIVWPLIADIPDDLLEKEKATDGGRVRLTDRGKAIAMYV